MVTMMMMENHNNKIINTPTTNNNLSTTGALFAVLFFDGEREIDLGTVSINPSMNFKSFQSLISQKIGISPHQITTYFTPLNHHHHQRRRPVTNKFDFAAAMPESTTSFFWVVLKRSRRLRRRRPKIEHEPLISPENEKFVLLRRNPNLEYVDMNMNMMMREKLERERRYLMSLNLNSNVYSDLSLWNYYGINGSDDGASSSGGGSENNNRVFCDVCWNAQIVGETVPFHWCKNDAVTKVYRSPAGPIAPPGKSRRG